VPRPVPEPRAGPRTAAPEAGENFGRERYRLVSQPDEVISVLQNGVTVIVKRVASPDQPFAGQDRLTQLRRDPGEILVLRALPFYRLARTLGLQAGVEHWSHGSDSYTYASPEDELPGIDPNVLAEDSETNATLLSVGITYSNPGRLRPGGTGLPVDATWSYERVLRASGRVPNSHAVRARFRVYFGVW
jgi:hypothetical protein